MGPRYGLSSHPPLRLCCFNKDIYGEYKGQQIQHKLLVPRYWDLEQTSLWQHRHDTRRHHPFCHYLILPSPFNKGNEWYAEVIATIKADISQLDLVEDWKRFWSQTIVFHKYKEFLSSLSRITFRECGLPVWS
jgi:hypothetical protein